MSIECEIAMYPTAQTAGLVIRDGTLTVMAEECGWPRPALDVFKATKHNPFASAMYELMTTDVTRDA